MEYSSGCELYIGIRPTTGGDVCGRQEVFFEHLNT